MSTNTPNDNRYLMAPHQLQSAKTKEIEKSRARLLKRADLIVKIINRNGKATLDNNWIYFGINGLERMIEETLDVIRNWNGGKYIKPVKTEKDCWTKTRNYWCREKSKPIANSIIYPVLSQLCQHINQFECVSPADKLLLYIDIIDSMLRETIQFKSTSDKPLILNAMFYKNNKFKRHCRLFIKYFNLNELNTECAEWGSVKTTRSVKKSNETKATSKYIPDSKRAQNLHDSFVEHLRNIKVQISKCKDMNLLQIQLNCFMIDMGVKMENDNNRYVPSAKQQLSKPRYNNNRYNDNNIHNITIMGMDSAVSTPLITINNNGLSRISPPNTLLQTNNSNNNVNMMGLTTIHSSNNNDNMISNILPSTQQYHSGSYNCVPSLLSNTNKITNNIDNNNMEWQVGNAGYNDNNIHNINNIPPPNMYNALQHNQQQPPNTSTVPIDNNICNEHNGVSRMNFNNNGYDDHNVNMMNLNTNNRVLSFPPNTNNLGNISPINISPINNNMYPSSINDMYPASGPQQIDGNRYNVNRSEQKIDQVTDNVDNNDIHSLSTQHVYNNGNNNNSNVINMNMNNEISPVSTHRPFYRMSNFMDPKQRINRKLTISVRNGRRQRQEFRERHIQEMRYQRSTQMRSSDSNQSQCICGYPYSVYQHFSVDNLSNDNHQSIQQPSIVDTNNNDVMFLENFDGLDNLDNLDNLCNFDNSLFEDGSDDNNNNNNDKQED